jgi:hypothetical protein
MPTMSTDDKSPALKTYADRLVRLTPDRIRFRWYYFPIGTKSVPLNQIDRVETYSVTGCLRLWGTGDFRTWFPLDFKRPVRKCIYVLYRKSGFVRIGFTVKDDERFQAALRQAGIEVRPGSLADQAAANRRAEMAAILVGLSMVGAAFVSAIAAFTMVFSRSR